MIDWNWVVGVLEDALSQAAANWLTIAITFVVTLLKDWIERLFKGKRKRKHGKRKRRR